MRKKNLTVRIFSCLLFVIGFIGCSNVEPETLNTNYSVIFEYKDNETPSARLSVFVEIANDPRRSEELEVNSLKENYKWVADELVLIIQNKRQFAGYPNFIVPEDNKIPEGEYSVFYRDFKADEAYSSFIVSYDKNIYKMSVEESTDFFTKNGFYKRLAVYDSFNTMIFFGQETEENDNPEKILRNNKSASYYNVIWYNKNNTTVCIMPKQQLR